MVTRAVMGLSTDLQKLVHDRLRTVLKAGKQLGGGKKSEVSVHKIRVLLRRLDSLLGLLIDLKTDKKLKKAVKVQNKLRKSLGKVRAVDVHREGWKKRTDGKAYAHVIDRELGLLREKALAGFLKKFDRARMQKAARKLEKAVRSLPAAAVGMTLKDRLEGLVERITEHRAELHEVRLDIKRLRYCLEELARLRGQDPAGREDVAFLKEMQEELGQINDDETLSAFLREWRKEKGGAWSRTAAAGVEKIAEEAAKEAAVARRRWQKFWPARRQRLRGLL